MSHFSFQIAIFMHANFFRFFSFYVSFDICILSSPFLLTIITKDEESASANSFDKIQTIRRSDISLTIEVSFSPYQMEDNSQVVILNEINFSL